MKGCIREYAKKTITWFMVLEALTFVLPMNLANAMQEAWATPDSSVSTSVAESASTSESTATGESMASSESMATDESSNPTAITAGISGDASAAAAESSVTSASTNAASSSEASTPSVSGSVSTASPLISYSPDAVHPASITATVAGLTLNTKAAWVDSSHANGNYEAIETLTVSGITAAKQALSEAGNAAADSKVTLSLVVANDWSIDTAKLKESTAASATGETYAIDRVTFDENGSAQIVGEGTKGSYARVTYTVDFAATDADSAGVTLPLTLSKTAQVETGSYVPLAYDWASTRTGTSAVLGTTVVSTVSPELEVTSAETSAPVAPSSAATFALTAQSNGIVLTPQSSSLTDLFTVSGVSGRIAPQVSDQTISFPRIYNEYGNIDANGSGGVATSKFSLDFSRSFSVTGSFSSPSFDGVSFALHTDPGKTATTPNFSTSMVNKGMNYVPQGQGYDIGSVETDSGMPCGLLWNVMTIDRGSTPDSSDHGIYSYRMSGTTHSVFSSTSGDLTAGWVDYVIPATSTFEISFDCSDPATGAGTLTFSAGGKTATYNLTGDTAASKIFDTDASGTADSSAFRKVYFSMSSWVPSTSTNISSLTFSNFEYTDWPPTINATTFWANRDSNPDYETQVGGTTGEYAKKGETVQVRHELVSKTGVKYDFSVNTAITQLQDVTPATAVNLTGTDPIASRVTSAGTVSSTASLTNNASAYNTTSALTNYISAPIYSQGTNGTEGGKTYFAYSVASPDVCVHTVSEAAVFGTEPFSPLSSTAATYTTGYQIVYNGLTGATPSTEAVLDVTNDAQTGLIPTPDPTKVGCSLLGWYTKDGTSGDWGTQVTSSTAFSALKSLAVDGVVNLYAKWQGPVCKIVTNGVATPYPTLAAALAAAGSATTDTTIEMLVENYAETAQEKVANTNGKTISITTASATATDGYPYQGTSGTYCTIKRNANYGSMFSVTQGGLAFTNITIDGNRASYSCSENGGLVKVASGCTFDMQSGSTLQNSYLKNSITVELAQYGGGVFLSNGASMTMENGALATNCTALRYGGFLYQDSNTTFAATGGQMNGNTATETVINDPSGGAIMQNPGGTQITTTLGGNFSATGNQTDCNGSFIHGGKDNTCAIIIKDSASITGNSCISSAANYGGAVYNYGAKVEVEGSPTITDNTKTGITANSDIRLNNNTSLVVIGDLTGGKIGIYSDSFYQVGQKFGTSSDTASTVKGLYHLVNDRNSALYGCAAAATGTDVMWGLLSTSQQGYTVIFDKNTTDAVTGSMPNQPMVYGTEGTLEANTFERANYNFNGWNTTAEGTGTTFADQATSAEFTNVYGTTSVTLYAQWVQKPYSVSYDINGGDASSTAPATTYHNADDTVTVTAGDTVTRTGYTFAGWNTNKTAASAGTVQYAAGDAFVMGGAPVTLYAAWTANADTAYKVNYITVKKDGTTVVASTQIGKTGITAAAVDVAALAAERDYAGYAYDSTRTTYSDTAHATAQTAALPIAADGSLVVNLYYVEGTDVTIGYVATTGGSVNPASETLAPATGTAVGATATAAAGYTFVSWTDAGGNVLSTVAAFVPAKVGGLNVAATYSANFTENSDYIVAYDLNYTGATNPADKTGVKWTDAGLLPTVPTRTGYTFGGWHTDAAGTSAEVASTASFATVAGNAEPADKTVTLYAKWTANAYTVTFNVNGGTGTMDDESFVYDVAQALTANAFTRDGYTFMGWNTVATPSAATPGTSYTDQQSVSNLIATADGNVILYAQWQATTLTTTNKVVTVTDAKALANDGADVTDAALIGANSAAATVGGATVTPTVETISPTMGKSDIHSGTLGTYTVTYAAGTDTAKRTVDATVTVVPDGSVIDGSNSAYAGIAIYEAKDAKLIADKTDLYAAQSANATSLGQTVTIDQMVAGTPVSGQTVAQTIATGDWSKVKAGTLGSYDSNITVGTATSTGGKVIVVPDGSVISGSNSVNAQNTILTVSQAKVLASVADSAKLMYGATLNTSATRIYNNVSGYVAGVAGTATTISQTFANATDWATITAGTVGTYDVTYTAGSGADAATKTVTISVVPDGSVVGPDDDGDDAVYSKTILMKSADAIAAFDASTSSRDLMASAYNDVHAVLDGQTIANPQADTTDVTQTFANATDWDSIKTGTVGSYTVTYACGDAAPQKVRVIIIKDNATQNGDNAVVADSVTLKSSDAKALASATTLYGAGYNYVEGYYADANGVDINVVKNDAAIANASGAPGAAGVITQYASNGTTLLSASADEWTNGIKAGATGTYQVKYSITGQDTSQTDRTAVEAVNVTVVPDDSTVVGNTGDAVYARTYLTTSADAITDFGSAAADILYGASSTGTSTEYNRVIIDKTNTILTDSSTPTRKGASAQSIDSADWAKIQAGTIGAYDVSYKVTGDDASAKAVQVIVLPNGSVIDPDTNLAVFGKTVTIKAATAKALTAQSQLYGSAYNDVIAVKDGTQITIANLTAQTTQTLAASDWTKIQAGTTGSYDVTYTVTSTKDATKSVSTTGVKVIVVPDDTTIDPATNDTVTASTVVIDQTTAKGLSDVSTLYDSAYNNVSGNIAGTAIADPKTGIAQYASDNATQLSASTEWSDGIKVGVVGTYPVTYANLNGKTLENTVAKRTVDVIVVPDGSVISGTDSAYAGAKLYRVSDAKALTGKSVLYAAQSDSATSKGTAVTAAQMVAGTAVNGQTVAQTITDTDWNAITSGALGTYSSDIALDDATGTAVVTSNTGKVTVVPNGSEIVGTNSAYAGVKIYNQTQAKALAKTDLYAGQSANATSLGQTFTIDQMVAGTAVNGQTVAQTITSDDWAKVKAGMLGSYDSNIEVDNATGTAQVTSTGGKVIVVPDGSVISGTDAAYAGVKTYTVNEAKALAAQADLYEGQSCYGAYQGTVIAAADMTSNEHVSQGISNADWASIKAGTLGSYDSNIAIGTATSTGGKVIVVPNGSIIDPDTNTSVAAQSITLTPAQAKALTAATDLYGSSYNSVSGYIDGTAIASGDITAKAAQAFADDGGWAAINAGNLGTYSVTYTVASTIDPTKTVTKTVHVIVADGSGSEGGVICAADDFWLQKGTEPTDAELVTDAQATGYDTNTIPDTALAAELNSRGSLDTFKDGVYSDVSFTATNGTSTATATVTATVKDAVSKGTTYEISANDFELSVGEANTLIGGITTTADTRSGVAARVITTHAPEGWTADYTNVKAATGIYDVTYTCDDDTSVKVTVKCAVKDSVTETDGIVISGNTVYMSKATAAGYATDTAMQAAVLAACAPSAKVIATGENLTPAIVTTATPHGSSAANGVYAETLSATNGPVTAMTDIKVVVTDAVVTDNGVTVGGHKAVITTGEAADSTNLPAILKDRSGEFGKVVATGADATTAAAANANLGTAKGLYTNGAALTATNPDDTSKTASADVDVLVTDHVTKGATDTIWGDDFATSLDEVASIAAMSEEQALAKLVSLSSAGAMVNETGAPVAITAVDWSALKDATGPGAYDVTFTAEDGSMVTVKATIKGSSASTDAYSIAGSDFMLAKGSTKPDSAGIVANAGATGTKLSDGSASTVAVTDDGGLDTSTAGIFTISLVTPDTTTTGAAFTTVKATVKDTVTPNVDNDETIGANDFYISLADANALAGDDSDLATLSALAAPSAYVTSTGAPVAVTGVDATALKAAMDDGSYDVTFSTAKGSTATVKGIIKDSVTTDDGVTVAGNTVYLSTAQAAAAKDDAAIKALVLGNASAAARRLDTGATLAPAIESTNTPYGSSAAPGTYAATLAASYTDSAGASHGAQTDIKVIVADHVGTSDAYVIAANDFMVAKGSAVTDASQIAAANAVGTIKSTGASAQVVVASSTLDTSKKGVCDVTFDTPNTTDENLATTTAKATVKDYVTTDPDTGETIGANNFSMSLAKANALTDADISELITLAAAKAVNTSDGSPMDIASVDYSQLKAATAISGDTYPVTFTTAAGTSVTVQVTVTDAPTHDTKTGESIVGDDYVITPDQAAAIIAGGAAGTKLAVEKGKVTAVDTATGADVAIATVDAGKLSVKPGTYPVTYATDAGTTVTLYATVAGDNTTVDIKTHEAIDAADFAIDTVTASTLTDAQILELSGARAWSTKDGSSVEIASIVSKVEAVAGVYEVTFATAAGTTRTIKVTVTDVKPVSIDPPVTKTVTGNAPAATYTFKMEAGSAAYPMPAGSSNGAKYASIQASSGAQNALSVEFGTITYTTVGTYTYRISEVAGNSANMTYDATVYSIKVVVTDVNGALQAEKTITDGTGATVDAAAFANAYKEPAASTSTSTTTVTETIVKTAMPKMGDPLWWGGVMIMAVACTMIVTAARRKRRGKDSNAR